MYIVHPSNIGQQKYFPIKSLCRRFGAEPLTSRRFVRYKNCNMNIICHVNITLSQRHCRYLFLFLKNTKYYNECTCSRKTLTQVLRSKSVKTATVFCYKNYTFYFSHSDRCSEVIRFLTTDLNLA